MSVERDAHEFGLHVKQGGWRLGLLVARNVEKGSGQGARQPHRTREEVGKVSAAEFARLSDTSADRVLRHLEAWDNAANAGHVKPARKLMPDQDEALDVNALPPWSNFYPPQYAGRMKNAGKQAARERPDEVIEALLTVPQTAAYVATGLLLNDAVVDALNDPEERNEDLDAVIERLANLIYARRTPVAERDVAASDPSQYELDHLLLKAARPLHDARTRVERYGVRTMRPIAEAHDILDALADDVAAITAAVHNFDHEAVS